jgi:hypothetical protein
MAGAEGDGPAVPDTLDADRAHRIMEAGTAGGKIVLVTPSGRLH